jgi:hypothetical protein
MQLGRPRAALAIDTGEPEWSAYSGALGRQFLLDQFLKSTNAKAVSMIMMKSGNSYLMFRTWYAQELNQQHDGWHIGVQ